MIKKGFPILVLSLLALFYCSEPEQPQKIKHPIINPPRYTEHIRCDNCGMDRNMFARTRYEFMGSNTKRYYTCSLACVIILCRKLNIKARNIMVAEYLHPESMIPAEKAIYVIGSRARGTMTKVSKLAFSSRKEAEAFVREFGGRITSFEEAYQMAEKEVF